MSIFLLAVTLGPGRCPAHSTEGLSPVAVVADHAGKRLYIAEATADQVAVFELSSGTVSKEIPVAERPVGIALSADGNELYVTSAVPAGLVQVVNVQRGKVTDRIPVGHTPVAVIPALDGRTLYVCNQFDNTVGVIDRDLRQQTATIPVPRSPVAAVLAPDGQALFVVNHLPAGPAHGDYTAAVISVLDTTAKKVIQTIELPDGSTSLRGIAISPDGRHAYVTHLLARCRFPVTYLERGWVNTNALSLIDVPGQRFINTVLLDDVDRGAANPHGVACTPDGRTILVTHSGSHELSLIDRKGLHAQLPPPQVARDFRSTVGPVPCRQVSNDSAALNPVPNDLTFMAGLRRRVKLAGKGPRGLAVAGSKVYMAEYFTDSLGVVDLQASGRYRVRSIRLGKSRTLSQARRGEMLFNDASASFQQWHSCASCHADHGRVDGLNWDLLNDDVGNAKNTKSLLLAHETPPAMITGVRPNAESAIRSGIAYIQFTRPREDNVRALSAYLQSLRPVPSPYLARGYPSEVAQHGERLFKEAGCVQCHSGPLYTDLCRHDVGTGKDPYPEKAFDTPTLVEAWRTAPYLHDGRAASVTEVLTTFNPDDRHGRTSPLSPDEIADLALYILTR